MRSTEYGLNILQTSEECNILQTDLRQRAFDGKWERLAKIVDYDNKYTYETESGSKVTLIPEKWVTLGVYDYLLEIVD